MPYIVDWHCLPGDASYGNNWQAPPKRKRSPSLSTGTQWSLRQHFDRGCICTLWLVTGGIKPFSYGPHRTGNSAAGTRTLTPGMASYPRFSDVNTLQSPTQNEKKLTKMDLIKEPNTKPL